MFSSSKKNVQPSSSSSWLSFGKKPNKANDVQINVTPQLAEHPTTLHPTRGSAAKVLSARGQADEQKDSADVTASDETPSGAVITRQSSRANANAGTEAERLKNKKLRERCRECSEGGGGSLNLQALQLSELGDHFASLKHVRTLNAKKNCFASVEPLLQLRFLEKLELSFNSQLGQHAESLRGLGSLQLLRSLDLSACGFAMVPDDLRELPRLEELFIRRNLLEDLPDWLVDLRHLYFLDLSGNRLSAVPPCLDDMPGLQILRLEGNACADAVVPESKVGHLVQKVRLIDEAH